MLIELQFHGTSKNKLFADSWSKIYFEASRRNCTAITFNEIREGVRKQSMLPIPTPAQAVKVDLPGKQSTEYPN